jgi:hypothetical protein
MEKVWVELKRSNHNRSKSKMRLKEELKNRFLAKITSEKLIENSLESM